MIPLNKDLSRKIKEKSRLHRRWIGSQPGVEKDLLMKKVRSHEKSDRMSQIESQRRKRYSREITQTSVKVFGLLPAESQN